MYNYDPGEEGTGRDRKSVANSMWSSSAPGRADSRQDSDDRCSRDIVLNTLNEDSKHNIVSARDLKLSQDFFYEQRM
jgi:hypothetical protein